MNLAYSYEMNFPKGLDVSPDGNFLIEMAANWMFKELQRASMLSMIKDNESANAHGRNLHTMLLDLVTSTYSDRFMDPVTIAKLQEMAKGDTLQSFIYGRLAKLAMLQGFTRDSNAALADKLLLTFITPRVEAGEKYPQGPEAVYQATTPDIRYLKAEFTKNHWIVLLFFAINSFQLKGYDNYLIASAVSARPDTNAK